VDSVQGVDRTKVVAVAVEVLTGLADTMPGRDMHRLRGGLPGTSTVVEHPVHGTAWRVALQIKTASARDAFQRGNDGKVVFAPLVSTTWASEPAGTSTAPSAHMGSMRTLDRDYLATHPKGDEKATLTLHLPIPASIDVPDNADGTRPAVTLKATGGPYSSPRRCGTRVTTARP
jgi:hypothetical protein